jgi:hypothetical protein
MSFMLWRPVLVLFLGVFLVVPCGLSYTGLMPLNPGCLTINNRERKELIRLLGLLQTHLESTIESCLIPGTNEGAPEDQAGILEDRTDWRVAENLVIRLQNPKRRRSALNNGERPESAEMQPEGGVAKT